MIRRDYLLRMIEEFIRALTRMKSLRADLKSEEAAVILDAQFQRLVGTGAAEVSRLTETELEAGLIRGEPTHIVREKTLMLTALLKEAGDMAEADGRREESRACYVKGLNLLLLVLSEGEPFELPEFVPRLEVFLSGLQDSPLPLATEARLMQQYERVGEFARAEDALFAMLEAEPGRPGLVDFGISFYERIRGQSDAALAAGNLPRSELATGLNALLSRKELKAEPPGAAK